MANKATINILTQPVGTIYWGFSVPIRPLTKNSHKAIAKYIMIRARVYNSLGNHEADLNNPNSIVNSDALTRFKNLPTTHHSRDYSNDTYGYAYLIKAGVNNKPLAESNSNRQIDCHCYALTYANVEVACRTWGFNMFDTKEDAIATYKDLLEKYIEDKKNHLVTTQEEIKSAEEFLETF